MADVDESFKSVFIKEQFIHESDCYVLVRDAERRYIDSRGRQEIENKLWRRFYLFENI